MLLIVIFLDCSCPITYFQYLVLQDFKNFFVFYLVKKNNRRLGQNLISI